MMDALSHNGFCNPSSTHALGVKAKEVINTARENCRALINAEDAEESKPNISLTERADGCTFPHPGGSESINHAIKGTCWHRYRASGVRGHIITSVAEHVAVLETCRYLEQDGYRVTFLPVDRQGRVKVQDVLDAVCAETVLVTLMHANNEVGTLNPISEIARAVKGIDSKIIIHTDASQSVGKAVVDVQAMGVDLLTIAGHKLYAPKGVGALYIRGSVALEKLIHGASHEHNRRAGTEACLQLVAFGTACLVAKERLRADMETYEKLRGDLLEVIRKHSSLEVVVNGPEMPSERLCNTLSISFIGINSHTLLKRIEDRIAASAGSACHSSDGPTKVSHVLRAMGLPLKQAVGTLRLSLGRSNSIEEVHEAGLYLCSCINELTKAAT